MLQFNESNISVRSAFEPVIILHDLHSVLIIKCILTQIKIKFETLKTSGKIIPNLI